jgi:hypothetical protein
MSYCARALGHVVDFKLELPKERELRGDGLIKFARCDIKWNKETPDVALKQSIMFRQTSRKKYDEGLGNDLVQKLETIAKNHNMDLRQLDSRRAKQTIWLNQRAVFDDMFDEPVRQELDHWLRYSKAQKEAKKDGLSYDCMELNGNLLKFIVDHPKTLRLPVISSLIKQYYLKTMKDSSDVFYMLAPFASEDDSYNVGIVIMRIWMELSQQKKYLHPFGTIMSNHAAHQDFLKLVDVQQESREDSYLVFIFRGGRSATPATSLRIPVTDHLVGQ